MKEFEELIYEMFQDIKLLDMNMDHSIKFDKQSGLIYLKGSFKVPDTGIPMDNLMGRKELKITITLYDIMHYIANKKMGI